MKIDIDQLTEAELIDLNHLIVERLRFLDQMRAHVETLEFKIGDRRCAVPSVSRTRGASLLRRDGAPVKLKGTPPEPDTEILQTWHRASQEP